MRTVVSYAKIVRMEFRRLKSPLSRQDAYYRFRGVFVVRTAILALADGTVFRGKAFGAENVTTVGEVVFNTSMTGYQEILTDPSYASQIVTLTYPHIGNYGTNDEDVESSEIFAMGLIIRDLPVVCSNFRSTETLSDFLKKHDTPGIYGIDTRMLTRLLRDKGAQNGCLSTDPSLSDEEAVAKAAALGKIVTVEDHGITGGLGSAVCESICRQGLCAKVKSLGIVDTFGRSGDSSELFKYFHIDVSDIVDAALN